MYPTDLIASMEGEMTSQGFKALKTAAEVNTYFGNHQGVSLLFINSVCGCAGIGARAGVIHALQTSAYQADHLVTVFAGVDAEAFEVVQEYIKPYPLSSPAIALIKDNSVVHFIERHQIKGQSDEYIAAILQQALGEYSAKK